MGRSSKRSDESVAEGRAPAAAGGAERLAKWREKGTVPFAPRTARTEHPHLARSLVQNQLAGAGDAQAINLVAVPDGDLAIACEQVPRIEHAQIGTSRGAGSASSFGRFSRLTGRSSRAGLAAASVGPFVDLLRRNVNKTRRFAVLAVQLPVRTDHKVRHCIDLYRPVKSCGHCLTPSRCLIS